MGWRSVEVWRSPLLLRWSVSLPGDSLRGWGHGASECRKELLDLLRLFEAFVDGLRDGEGVSDGSGVRRETRAPEWEVPGTRLLEDLRNPCGLAGLRNPRPEAESASVGVERRNGLTCRRRTAIEVGWGSSGRRKPEFRGKSARESLDRGERANGGAISQAKCSSIVPPAKGLPFSAS